MASSSAFLSCFQSTFVQSTFTKSFPFPDYVALAQYKFTDMSALYNK